MEDEVKVCPSCGETVCVIVGYDKVGTSEEGYDILGNRVIIPTTCKCGCVVTKDAENWVKPTQYREQTEEEMDLEVEKSPYGALMACPVCGWHYSLTIGKKGPRSPEADSIIAHQHCGHCADHTL